MLHHILADPVDHGTKLTFHDQQNPNIRMIQGQHMERVQNII
jgi:hypothetical protein